MRAKIIACAVAAVLLLTLAGCSSDVKLPKGKAKRIEFVAGNELNCQFEYVTETTVKIIRENGTVMYVPTSNIERIYVEE